MIQATAIAKEQVASLHFAHHDVLPETDRKIRSYNLQKALTLGNAYHGKVHIVFETESGQDLEVDTTIWAVTDTHISLKGGVAIPINAIKDVIFA